VATLFKFRLERLIELRQIQVDHCLKLLALAIAQVEKAKQSVLQLIAENEALNQGWQQARLNGMSALEGMSYQSSIQLATEALYVAREHVQRRKEEENASRVTLEKAMSKHKALVKMKEKQKLRHQTTQNRLEQAQLDEFAILRNGSRR
jgi:flagellar export protein FliJ